MNSPFHGPEHRSFAAGDSARRALLLHGFMGTPAELRPVAELLLARGWQVRAPLLPGFGADLGTLGKKRWPDWLEQVRREAAHLRDGAGRFMLLGFSMGGALALLEAASHPPDSLVLIAPFTRFADWRLRFLPLVKYVVPELKPFKNVDFADPETRKLLEHMQPGASLDDPEVQRVVREQYTMPLRGVDELRKLGLRASRAAKAVACETLVLQGKTDTTAYPTFTQRLSERLPRSQLELLPGGHDLVKPDAPGHRELLGALERYLARFA